MEFTFENLMTGERHPCICVCPSNPNHLILKDRDTLSTGLTEVANGYSLLIEEQKDLRYEDTKGNWTYQWRLYNPNDGMNRYVSELLRSNNEFWESLEKIKNSLPQPNVDREREQRELSEGLRSWKSAWNRDNARTGQAYMGVDGTQESGGKTTGVRGSHLGSSNDWVRGKD